MLSHAKLVNVCLMHTKALHSSKFHVPSVEQSKRKTEKTYEDKHKRNKNKKSKTNLCCELVRRGGGIGVDLFVRFPLETTTGNFLLRGNGTILSCANENVLCRVSSFIVG